MTLSFNRGLVLLVSLLVLSLSPMLRAQPANISPQMLQQFKSLPPAQQQALAKQYGIDLSQFEGVLNPQGPYKIAQPGQPLEQAVNQQDELSLMMQQLLMLQSEINPEDEELERFGQSLFQREVSTFAPTDDMQIPDDYRLGVGDELVIQLFGKDNENLTLPVGRDGSVQFPRLGPISVAGLAFDQAQQVIKQTVAEQMIGVNAVVTLGRLRAINVFIAGEVEVPGAYSVSALATVSQAIYQAGGVTDIGSLRNIQVKRAGELVGTFDVYDLLLEGDGSGDVRLRSGDVVFVPTFDRLITVEGEIKRPMKYEVMPNDTIASAIAMAGGFKSTAFKGKGVLVQRGPQQDQPTAHNIDLASQQQLAKTFNDGDVLRIMPVGEGLTNAVTISGAVVRPGAYGWTEGMRISDLMSDVRRDLLPNTDLGYALLVHEINDRLDIQVEQFDLASAILQPGTEADPLVSPRDHVLVFEDNYIASLNELARIQLEQEEQNKEEKKRNKEQLTSLVSEKSTLNSAQDQGLLIAGASSYIDSEDELSPNIRSELLRPVLERLRNQARAGEDIKIVSISGAVKFPGEYPLPVNYQVADLIAAAGGLKDSAYLPKAEFRRLTQQQDGSNSVAYTQLDLVEVLQNGGPSLSSRDHLTVHETVDWHPSDQIVVKGEVMFPGTYLIQRGETLSDIIERAGGLTSKAFAEGAEFTRKTIAEIENQRAKDFAESVRRDFASSMLTEEKVTANYREIELIARSLENFEGKGRLLVNLRDAINGDTSADIPVMDGDVLSIPQQSNTVTVVGEVRRQGTHSFQDNLMLEDYLGLSAGITARADDGAIYIVRADGSVRFPETSWTRFTSSSERLAPGDTIVVPVDSQHKESISLWRDITQIIYQGAVSIAAVARL